MDNQSGLSMNMYYSSRRQQKYCSVCGEYLFNKHKHSKYCKKCADNNRINYMKCYNEKQRSKRMQVLSNTNN